MNFEISEINIISKSSPFLAHQFVIPIEEKNRILKKFKQYKEIKKPDYIIIDNNDKFWSKYQTTLEDFKIEFQNKNFVILDAAMNDLMRPALYGAKHQIIPSIKNKKTINKIFEFVGPICESTDKFLTTNKFQNLKEGDVLLICDVGAYGLSLGSNYNVRPLPAEILIKNSKILTSKNRQKLSDII